jgi:Cd2+/Zn2+-exporting ATPase
MTTAQTTLTVRGMDCATCAESLAAGLRATPGVAEASVSFGTGMATLAYDPAAFGPERAVARVRALGYEAEARGQERRNLLFDVSGMDCADCARTIEKTVAALPGVAAAAVNFGAATLAVTPAPQAADPSADIAAAVARAGYRVRPRGAASTRSPGWRDRRLLPVLAAAALWVAADLVERRSGGPEWLPAAMWATAMLVCGLPFARAALMSIRARRLDMNALMTISALGAAALGEWSEGAMVVALFALGGTLQSLTLDRTRGAIRDLMDLSPAMATILRNGVEEVVAAATVRPGDLMRVRPGERLAADGRVVEGASAIDQAPITGESIPVDKTAGDEVFAGTLNGQGALLVEATRPAEDSTLARIVHLVEEAQGSKAPTQALVDRFAAVYTPVVIAVAASIAAAGFVFADDPRAWIYRALVLLVIACPCALVISTPVAIVAAIGAATRRGVLVKGGSALEALGSVRVVAFDKTGTLTAGTPRVVAVEPLEGGDIRGLLATAAAVEALSEHPLARAVLAHARHEGLTIVPATDFRAEPGRGAAATVAGRRVGVGSERWAREHGLLDTALAEGRSLAGLVQEMAAAGRTPLVVGERTQPDGEWRALGAIAIADEPRPTAAASVAALHDAGIEHVVVLTGDTAATGAAVATAVGADEVLAELLPADKAAAIAALRDRHGAVAMVGDGVNDAPALATADVGIAMGGRGTAVALETADMALMGDDLDGLAAAVRLSRRTTAIIRQNVALSLAVKALALALGAFGFVGLWIAVLADMGTSLLVTLNGLRLARRPKQ